MPIKYPYISVQAAFHEEAPQAYDLYYQADLQCSPWGDHHCEVWLNHAQLRDTLPFRLRPGSLLDFYVEPGRAVRHERNGDDADLDQTLFYKSNPDLPASMILWTRHGRRTHIQRKRANNRGCGTRSS